MRTCRFIVEPAEAVNNTNQPTNQIEPNLTKPASSSSLLLDL